MKKEEIIKLERLKYDFFRGASHELKTPLASLKIILENMQYNIGKYKDRDFYIGECIGIVDKLSHNVSQILLISKLENLKNDQENINIGTVLKGIMAVSYTHLDVYKRQLMNLLKLLLIVII